MRLLLSGFRPGVLHFRLIPSALGVFEMKTLTRLMVTGAVLAAGGAALAADCPNSAPRYYYSGTNGAPAARYSYRSGYMGGVQSTAPMTTTAPRQAMGVYSYTSNTPSLGPEAHLDYARARQHVRGW
ncbi:hypothetical protein AYO47_06405 [Planctomyces sp. SCGC AG-212-M04]|nr:hypothetical protein AYO47_06405 [Planctomyces sp. SCGC AG-212-M04]